MLFFTLTFFFPALSFFAPFTLILFLSTYAVGLGPITWVLVSEIYPLAIRAHAIAAMTFLSWLSTFLVVFTFRDFLLPGDLLGPLLSIQQLLSLDFGSSFGRFRKLKANLSKKSNFCYIDNSL